MSDMLWISVPGGFAHGNLSAQEKPLLRVLVVPRLDGGSLAGHGMAVWPPPALRTGTVRVELFRPGAGPTAVPDRKRDLAPVISFQTGVWERLVAGLAIEDATERQGTVDADQLAVHATSEDAAAVVDAFGQVASVNMDAEKEAQSKDFADQVRDVLQSEHWLRPEPPSIPSERLEASPRRPGFNRALSLLREHPTVLRALGLTFELKLDPRDVVDYAEGTVRVVWPGKPASLPAIVSPRTKFGPEFRPGSTDRVKGGMVTLDRTDAAGNPLWQVATVDVDVAVQRLREAARAHKAHPTAPPTLPALRSNGLQLILCGRGREMRERLIRAAGLRGALPDVLTADDLVLGYRIDVQHEQGSTEWFSLHQRFATYESHARRESDESLDDSSTAEGSFVIGQENALEEGHLKTNAATRDETGVHADEIVAGWRGWSLAVERPPVDGSPPPTPPADPGLNLGVSFEIPPNSLPPLRFGHDYTLRARVADPAGGGVELDDEVAEQHSTESTFYARHEPLPAPVVEYPPATDPEKLPPGESAELVVVRSDPMSGLDVTAYAGSHGYPLHDKRVLWPPDGSPELAEQHGKFDLEGDPAVVAYKTWQWVRRAFVEVGSDAGPEEGLAAGHEEEWEAAFKEAEQLRLPDPAAGGITVTRTDTTRPIHLQLAWDAMTWPNLPPRTLHLTTPKPGRPVLAWEGDRLVARLEPAQSLTVDLSTFPPTGITDQFALGTANPPEGAAKAFRKGRHPLVTPARPVTLVHAVQQPLRLPDTTLESSRPVGATFAELQPQSDVFDPQSTAEVHVTARWEDQVDVQRVEVTEVPVDTLTIDPSGPAQPTTLFRHEFGDTRHRTVTYTLKAISRFRDYFRNPELVDEFAVVKELQPVIVDSSARPDPPVILSTRPAFLWKETGDLDAVSHSLTRERSAGRIRLALQSPWHSSGPGELLAVVMRPEGANLDDDLSAYVSAAGGDPLYVSRGIPVGSPFAPQVSSGTGGVRVRLREAAADVIVKPHQPEYHKARDYWSCDVALTGNEGTPFHGVLVQLAVARYQPHSLEGLSLSPVVRTDIMPLLPDRTVRVTRLANRFQVTLTGPVARSGAGNRVDMVVERCSAPSGVTPGQVDLVAGRGSAITDVPSWRCAWVQEAKVKPVAPGYPKEWTSDIYPPPDTGALRVRIREVEFIPNSTSSVGSSLNSGTPDEITERTVFTDTVPLPEL
ncbi:hypothetical protein [Streptomyces sp. JHA19]|uniref:hypothetical protein n=1 Tax=Streptomyces sp. JHA19 TaxID=1577588 RepID=UPI0006E24692|nr:hypothetical protein [Streptomyces sp. JHA19]